MNVTIPQRFLLFAFFLATPINNLFVSKIKSKNYFLFKSIKPLYTISLAPSLNFKI